MSVSPEQIHWKNEVRDILRYGGTHATELMNGVLLNVCLLHQSATYGSTAIALVTSWLDVHVRVGSYMSDACLALYKDSMSDPCSWAYPVSYKGVMSGGYKLCPHCILGFSLL